VRLSSVHDAPELHLAEALECFVASDASAVVEHTKQCASVPLLAGVCLSMGRATVRSAHAHGCAARVVEPSDTIASTL